jgi:hypothetical protein
VRRLQGPRRYRCQRSGQVNPSDDAHRHCARRRRYRQSS